MEITWKKYTYTFLITAVIFITAIFTSNYFNQKKINEVKSIESRIAVDILASETQFSLLSELTCKDIGDSFLSKELAELGEKLSYLEESRGVDDAEVLNLKRYYSLLEIKDYLLVKKIGEQCLYKLIPILFFYSADCPKCDEQGYVLTRMRQDYDQLRVYSFDYGINVSAVKTLASVYGVTSSLPALVINGKTYNKLQYIDDIENIVPEIKKENQLNFIISPHLDDAVFSLGGSIGTFTGYTDVVTIFAGTPNSVKKGTYWDKISSFEDSTVAVAERIKENDNAVAIYGARVINLKYLDGQYRENEDNDGLEQKIVNDIERIIKENNKQGLAINIYGPAIFDQKIEHPDHLIAHNVFIKMLKDMTNVSNLRFFVYEDYPYVEESKNKGNRDVFSVLKNKYPGFNFKETPIILNEKDLDYKEQAIKQYSSQIKAFKKESKDVMKDAIDWSKQRCQTTVPHLSACEVIYEISKK